MVVAILQDYLEKIKSYRIEREKLSVERIADFLYRKGENGLKARLALTGFSNENLMRLVTFIRTGYFGVLQRGRFLFW